MAPKKEKSGPSKASKDRAVRATRRELAKQTPVAMETKRARLETSSSSNLDNDQDGDIDLELEIDDLLAASSLQPPSSWPGDLCLRHPGNLCKSHNGSLLNSFRMSSFDGALIERILAHCAGRRANRGCGGEERLLRMLFLSPWRPVLPFPCHHQQLGGLQQ